ncbi:hypothetical protein E2C01_091235 [Portunus trituberculatus]|uniref:Uncharacterized protein n=1 Tax=Portunus trituberculatus TaxID=210409 RepID=A0A5B7JDF7_PORTR|nr:hypothetical protein [Portunus trituberculatus]
MKAAAAAAAAMVVAAAVILVTVEVAAAIITMARRRCESKVWRRRGGTEGRTLGGRQVEVNRRESSGKEVGRGMSNGDKRKQGE